MAKVVFGYCADINSKSQELMPLIEIKTSTDFLDKMDSLHQEIEKVYDSLYFDKVKAFFTIHDKIDAQWKVCRNNRYKQE